MPYSLGAVKPHVKDAADKLGPKYGYTVVYGWGIGSVPNSDHPKGLALDFMGSNRARGDALVADLIANRSAYAVKYIIWRGQIWENGAWRKYTGINPHYDHVHVSFLATAGSGVATDPVALPGVGPLDPFGGLVGTLATQVAQLFSVFRDINDRLKWITDRDNWVRIGLFAGGGLLILIGLLWLVGKEGKVTDAVKATGKAATGAVSNAK